MDEADIPEYDPERAYSRDEMIENIDGLLPILTDEVAFLSELRDRLQAGEEMEVLFEEFLLNTRLDDIDDYIHSL